MICSVDNSQSGVNWLQWEPIHRRDDRDVSTATDKLHCYEIKIPLTLLMHHTSFLLCNPPAAFHRVFYGKNNSSSNTVQEHTRKVQGLFFFLPCYFFPPPCKSQESQAPNKSPIRSLFAIFFLRSLSYDEK